MTEWFLGLPEGVRAWLTVVGAALVALLLHAFIYRVYGTLGRRYNRMLVLDGSLLRHSRGPMRLIFPTVAVRLVFPYVDDAFQRDVRAFLAHLFAPVLIFSVAWLLIRLTHVLDDLSRRHFRLDVEDNLRARQLHTRYGLLRRVLVVVIGFLGLAVWFLQYQGLRSIGTGLLASAGVIGVIIGVAAQRPLSNLIAGVQIAITQPIRVDDAVIVEGEFGWVEEITLTYVVVRVWDLRRIVLPISYLVEKPFQNWTRTTASLIGTVFVYVDYSVPVDEVRKELRRICEGDPLWDGNVAQVHVTELKEQTVELRCIVSASNAGRAFDLRANVREALMAFLVRRYPHALPRTRAEVQRPTRMGEDGEPSSER